MRQANAWRLDWHQHAAVRCAWPRAFVWVQRARQKRLGCSRSLFFFVCIARRGINNAALAAWRDQHGALFTPPGAACAHTVLARRVRENAVLSPDEKRHGMAAAAVYAFARGTIAVALPAVALADCLLRCCYAARLTAPPPVL
jgi:hypothetical protein